MHIISTMKFGHERAESECDIMVECKITSLTRWVVSGGWSKVNVSCHHPHHTRPDKVSLCATGWEVQLMSKYPSVWQPGGQVTCQVSAIVEFCFFHCLSRSRPAPHRTTQTGYVTKLWINRTDSNTDWCRWSAWHHRHWHTTSHRLGNHCNSSLYYVRKIS